MRERLRYLYIIVLAVGSLIYNSQTVCGYPILRLVGEGEESNDSFVTFDKDTVDLGEITEWSGDNLTEVEFGFVNNTEFDIYRVASIGSCSCTTVGEQNNIVASKERGNVIVIIDTSKGFGGKLYTIKIGFLVGDVVLYKTLVVAFSRS